MEFIKRQIEQIQRQLGGLSASQKMLTAALLVIMLMTLFYWTKYAGEPEMEPLLSQAISVDDMSRMRAHLSSQGITYKISGDKILVPTERKYEALAALGYAQMLPKNATITFEDVNKQLGAFTGSEERKAAYNNFKQKALEQVIRNFPNVTSASVFIDPTRERGIENNLESSASVYITMAEGQKAGKQLVNAAADLVAGAQAGLARRRISVIVDGVTWPVRDKDDPMNGSIGSDVLDQVQAWEKNYTRKISEQLAYIPNVLVSVTVKPDIELIKEQRLDYNKDGSVLTPSTIDQENEENNSSSSAGEPGAVPNAGLALSGSGTTGGTGGTKERNKTTFDNKVGHRQVDKVTPPGGATVMAAVVRVPRSYFVNIYKMQNPKASDVTDGALQPLIAAELPKIVADVKGCTGLKNDTDVAVNTYTDVMPPALAAMATVPSSAMPTSLGSHAKEIALGVLAVLSLLMMAMMVKRSTPASPVLVGAAAMAATESHNSPIHLAGGEDTVGIVGGGDTALDGMELDDDAVKSQQILGQVQAMVKENPDAAASLVKRWMNRS